MDRWEILELFEVGTGEWFAGEVVDPFVLQFSSSGALEGVVDFEVIRLVCFLTWLALLVMKTFYVDDKSMNMMEAFIIEGICDFPFAFCYSFPEFWRFSCFIV